MHYLRNIEIKIKTKIKQKEESRMRFGTLLSQFLRVFLPTLDFMCPRRFNQSLSNDFIQLIIL